MQGEFNENWVKWNKIIKYYWLIYQIIANQSSFNIELCKTLLTANIPLAKLNNTKCRYFFKNLINFEIPDKSKIRKKSVEKSYFIKLQSIRHYVGDKKM